MYQLMKLQMLLGFALSLLKDLQAKYLDGKLTGPELAELLPSVVDMTEFIKDIQIAKDVYTKLNPDLKAKLINYLVELLILDVAEITKLINLLFTFIGDSKQIFEILSIKLAPDNLVNNEEKKPE